MSEARKAAEKWLGQPPSEGGRASYDSKVTRLTELIRQAVDEATGEFRAEVKRLTKENRGFWKALEGMEALSEEKGRTICGLREQVTYWKDKAGWVASEDEIADALAPKKEDDDE